MLMVASYLSLGLAVLFVFGFFVDKSSKVELHVVGEEKSSNMVDEFVLPLLFLLGLSVAFTMGDAYIKFDNAYRAFSAYEDGEFSDREIGWFSSVGGVPVNVLNAMRSGELTDKEMAQYEEFVNDEINNYDSSEDKLKFKRKVLIRERGLVKSFWDDEQLSSQERRLIGFMGDVLGEDTSVFWSDASSDKKNSVDVVGINGLLKEFGEIYPKFNNEVDDEKVKASDEDVKEELFYRVEENK